MSLNKLIIIFGIILVIFAGIVFFQFSSKTAQKSNLKNISSTVKIKDHTFNVEVAKIPKDQQMGLSGIDSISDSEGMLFTFNTPDYYNFWMKDMKFPLDIIFIKDTKIVSIKENAVAPSDNKSNPPIIKPAGAINTVLEINAGLSKKYDIKPGDSVEIKQK
ncbi:MAG TPA: DUF192 domain-containing protein [Candidatus Saccharimonadales bacterium]|nr:DUF192 domain-containing protein [Candidatus Saccharimonadales bacterium]